MILFIEINLLGLFIQENLYPQWTPLAGLIFMYGKLRLGQRQLLLELASDAFVTMIIMLISTGLIVWFGVQFGLKPLLELQSAIRKRSADDLSEIKREVPKEVSSLLNSMNNLFSST